MQLQELYKKLVCHFEHTSCSASHCKSNFIDKAKQNIHVFLLTIQTLIASAYPKVFIAIFGQALLKYFLYNVGKKIKACLSTKPFFFSRMSAETWVSTGIYLFGLRHVHKNINMYLVKTYFIVKSYLPLMQSVWSVQNCNCFVGLSHSSSRLLANISRYPSELSSSFKYTNSKHIILSKHWYLLITIAAKKMIFDIKKKQIN